MSFTDLIQKGRLRSLATATAATVATPQGSLAPWTATDGAADVEARQSPGAETGAVIAGADNSPRRALVEHDATATLATGATIGALGRGPGESGATVAVTEVQKPRVENPVPTDGAARCWLLRYPDGSSVDLVCCPPESATEILARHPEALSAEPYSPAPRPPAVPLTGAEADWVRAWLTHIGESDPEIVREVLDRCQQDVGARAFYLDRAREVPCPALEDDRRLCTQCTNLARSGLCLAAHRDELPQTGRNFHPVDPAGQPRRCIGYAPGVDDRDRRPGVERWPSLARSLSESLARGRS